MPKVELNVAQTEYDLIREAAWKLNLPVEKLLQDELDAALTTISVWIQRTA